MESKSNLKKINLTGLEKVLSPKEMKNIIGGSCTIVCSDGTFHANSCEGSETFWCAGAYLISCCC